MESVREEHKPPSSITRPLKVPAKLLMGPGPTNAHPRVRKACSQPLLSTIHPEFHAIMDEIQGGLKYLFQTSNPLTFLLDGGGHAAMEASFVNMVEPGDRVLVLENGVWGQRAREVAEKCGGVVTSLMRPIGEVFTVEEIELGLNMHSPCVLFLCHGETSSGVLHPLEGIGDLCHKHGCLFMVDAVASLGAVPFLMDKWGIDIAYSGSHKVLSCPPGVSPISFGPRARAKLASRKTKVASFYFDLNWLMKCWAVDGATRIYHHTASVTTFYAVRESLSLLAQQGLEASWSKHRRNAELLWEGLESLGLELLVKDKALRLPTVTTVLVPHWVDWKEVVTHLMGTYSVEIAGGLGPSAGKVVKIPQLCSVGRRA